MPAQPPTSSEIRTTMLVPTETPNKITLVPDVDGPLVRTGVRVGVGVGGAVIIAIIATVLYYNRRRQRHEINLDANNGADGYYIMGKPELPGQSILRIKIAGEAAIAPIFKMLMVNAPIELDESASNLRDGNSSAILYQLAEAEEVNINVDVRNV